MRTIQRSNKVGQSFVISEVVFNGEVKSKIELGKDSILVDAGIDSISQSWFNWIMEKQLIQMAFSQLSHEEREFIMTGLTPDKWHEIFGKDDD